MKLPSFQPITWARLACACAAMAVLAFLIFGEKPWSIDLPPGKELKFHHYAVIYEWWAALFNLGVIALLGATAQWWLRCGSPAGPSRVSNPRWFWPLVAVAMGMTAFFGSQRISQSLWDDEEASLRRVILGQYRVTDGGNLELRETNWEAAFWNYWKPTNHQLQAILSKISLETWRAVTRPTGLQFTEAAVRLPCIIAAILSVAAISLLLRELGFPRAGAIAAFLLALHPWHVRYAIESRGYVFTALFGPLMVLFLLRALARGEWKWWAAFALAQLCLIYAFAGSIYTLVVANLCAFAAILASRHPFHDRLTQIARWAVVGVVSAGLYIQLILPCVPQLMKYLETTRAHGHLGTRWNHNLAAHLLTGVPWNNTDQPEAGYLELAWVAQAHPKTFAALAALLVLLFAIGAARLVARRPFGWIATAVFIVPGSVLYLVSNWKGHFLYEWYLFFTLPGLVAAVAVGLDSLSSAAGKIHRTATPVLAGLGVALFAVATHSQRQWLLTHPLQAMRESVLLTRPTLDPHDPRQKEILTVSITGVPRSYDPHIVHVSSVEELTAQLREADRAGKPLYMNFCNAWAAAAGAPDVFAMIQDDRLFEEVATIQGFDPTLTAYVRRYRPGSIASWTPQ